MHRYEITYAPRSTSQKNEHHSIRITLSSLEVAITHAFTRFIGEIPMRINLVETGREVWNQSKGSPYWIHWGTGDRDPYKMNCCSDNDARLWASGRQGVNKLTHLEKDGRLVWSKEPGVVDVAMVGESRPETSDSRPNYLLLFHDGPRWMWGADDKAIIDYATRPDEFSPSHVIRIGGSIVWEAPPVAAKKLEPDGGSCPLPAISPTQQGVLRKLFSQISDRIPPGTLPHNHLMRQHVLNQQRDSVEVLGHILSCAVVQDPTPLSPKPYVTIEELDDIVARTRAQRRGPADESSRRFQRGFTDHAQDMLVAEALLVAEGRS